MKEPIRAGHARIPEEWRYVLGMRWRRSAFVAVTGVHSRDDAFNVLAGHLPRLPIEWPTEFADEIPTEDAAAPYASAEEDDGYTDDIEAATRIARRLHAIGRRGPARQLVTAQVLRPNTTAVYVWRRAAAHEQIYRLYPSGDARVAGTFTTAERRTRSGHMRPTLTAHRYYQGSYQ